MMQLARRGAVSTWRSGGSIAKVRTSEKSRENGRREHAVVWKKGVEWNRRRFSSEENKKEGNGKKMSVKSKALIVIALVAGVGVVLYIYEDYEPGAPAPDPSKRKPRIVILGSGWAALNIIRYIDTDYYDVSIVSPRNYFLFTPLLPSVTVGTVDSRSITEAVRHFIDRSGSTVKYYEASCTDIDPQANKVFCKAKHDVEGGSLDFELEYDQLVVAVGAINNTFGTPGVYENATFLKEISDAVTIRRKIMDCFESANLPGLSEDEQRRLLNFVVVGGGPNGVEFAAELRDFVHENLTKSFPHLVPKVKITLLELMDHILNMYDARISDYTEKHFKTNHIDVLTKSQVLGVDKHSVKIRKTDTKQIEEIPYGLCVWSTGIGPSPLVDVIRNKIGESQTNRRAILTDGCMKVKGTNNIWAVGDCSTIETHRLVEKFNDLFVEADVSKSGNLTYDQFQNLIQKYEKKYPQIGDYGKRVADLFEEADTNKDGKLSLDEFKAIVSKVDSKVKMLPATAQVASQQGRYIGSTLNTLARGEELSPFQYRHFGSYAYIGDLTAVAELPNKFVLSGFGAWWLWRSIYWSKQVSWRNRVLVAFDWSKAIIFGRDITRN